MDNNSTGRFSDRVENYVKYRPTYPYAVLDTLQHHTGLTRSSVITDIGSGTGISTRLFLHHGNQVFAVEPNDEMRYAAEARLSEYSKFYSIPGTAERTTLADHSVDYIVVAQAFHWFDLIQAKQEFTRILRPGGWVILMWNTRQIDSTPFLKAYENLLQHYGTDYNDIRHRNIERCTLEDFLGKSMQYRQFPNCQLFDYDGLEGRLLSSSYTPTQSHPCFTEMIDSLKQIFSQYALNGQVSFDYDTELYLAQWQ